MLSSVLDEGCANTVVASCGLEGTEGGGEVVSNKDAKS